MVVFRQLRSGSISRDSVSTNLPPTAYVKMIDCWLIFSLIKPFVDIILQTYIQTLRDNKTNKCWMEGKRERKIRFSKIFLRVVYPTFFTVFVVIFWMIGLIHYILMY